MSMLVKAGTGLVAGIVAGLLGLAFMPQGAPIAVQPRQAVEKPQLVFAKEAGGPNVQTASAVVVSRDAAAPSTPAAAPKPAAGGNPVKVVELAKPADVLKPAPAAQLTPNAKPAPAASSAPIAVARVDSPEAASAPAMKPASPLAVAAPQAPAAAAPTNEAAARWSVPGLIALAKGDLSTARLFLARAAEAGDARAWVALADTYDPAILTKLGVVGAPGDPQRAKDYLDKAAAAGIVVAKDRTAALDQTSGAVH